MATSLKPEVIERRLSEALTDGEPPADLLERLGGWSAIAIVAPRLTDNPILTPVLSLTSRDIAAADRDTAEVRAAVAALVDAVTASTDPLQFGQGLDEFCRNELLLAMSGPALAARCLPLATPPQPTGGQTAPSPAQVSRHADALETYARLSLTGQASEYKLFGLIEDIATPQPRRYAQAVLRAIGAAYDRWTVDDRVVGVVSVLSGVARAVYTSPPGDAAAARDQQYGKDIASDACWTAANIELVRAFRASGAHDVIAHLGAALEALSFVKAQDERDDVEALDGALRLLRAFIADLVEHDGAARSAAEWQLDLSQVEALTRRVREFAVAGYGLSHWSGDRKQLVLAGWARLSQDLAWLRDKLDRDSLYDAAVVLDDLLQIYSASHTYEITHDVGGIEAVRALVRPAIADGFAARAGLMRNLCDHIEFLQQRVETANDDTRQDEEHLAAALVLQKAAKTALLAAPEAPGKDPAQGPAALPPLLAEFLEPHPGVVEALAGIDPALLRDLNTSLADIRDANALDHDVVVTEVRNNVLDALAPCPDFKGDVAQSVQVVLDQLIRFVSRRMNTQESSKDYLFKDDADEHDLHADLYDWLCHGPLSGNTNVEVQEVGAGRVDIQVSFPGFHLYLELKADETMVPISEKHKYIKQTVTYQATDVRIGFLVVLRLAPPKDKGPAPHLRDYVNHTAIEQPGSNGERHVVMLEIPGRQTKPSSVR
ncbi:hypothetical protein HFP15_32840 [Amycolatopsis sp. K13G38]|uniref:DUF3883 domain-containing protein n=1 Tax=Amycolatopsis acididurans TaxID=2724524 RepID=A0ABX1JD47_9PSEU|nr:hypothetical protein [Amycolatopsis acididurans]NKQ57659.1 hypothetical protein [Amycolatopsis acididurans]